MIDPRLHAGRESIHWLQHVDFELAKQRSLSEHKPILLDFTSAHPWNLRKAEAVYASPEIIRAVNEFTVPLRVDTDQADSDIERSRIIERHILICSPTVQMLSADGVTLHEISEAPRYTSLKTGCSGTCRDFPSRLTPDSFRSQLALGLAKFELHHAQPIALGILRSLCAVAHPDSLAKEEAAALLTVIRANGMRCLPGRIANQAMNPLAHTTARFCDTLVRISHGAAMHGEGHANAAPGKTADADRFASEICRHLMHFGTAIDASRQESVTGTQQLLRRLQRAHRSVQGSMIGVPDRLLDAHLPPKKRTIRSHLTQVMLAEYWTHSLMRPQGHGAPPESFGSLGALFERGESIHRALVDEFSGMSEQMLHLPTKCRNPAALSLGPQLVKLERHIQNQHAELNSLLQSATYRRSETLRSGQQIFSALGYVEGAMIGAETEFELACRPLIDLIHSRTNELARDVADFSSG